MLIQCTVRVGPTVIQKGKFRFRFDRNSYGHYICDINLPDVIKELLNMPGGYYREYILPELVPPTSPDKEQPPEGDALQNEAAPETPIGGDTSAAAEGSTSEGPDLSATDKKEPELPVNPAALAHNEERVLRAANSGEFRSEAEIGRELKIAHTTVGRILRRLASKGIKPNDSYRPTKQGAIKVKRISRR